MIGESPYYARRRFPHMILRRRKVYKEMVTWRRIGKNYLLVWVIREGCGNREIYQDRGVASHEL